MDRFAHSRRPNKEDTQDGRVGILIQIDLEARNVIATRSSTSGQPRDTATPQTTVPPQSDNDKFPLYLAKLDTLLRQIETSLSTINQSPTLTPPQTTSLKTVQQLLKANPNLNITPHILSQTIPQIPIPILKNTHQTRLTLDSCLTHLLRLDVVLRGDKAYEGTPNARGNGFLDWVKWGPEVLSDRRGKVKQVEALVERAVACDLCISDFLLGGNYGVEAWVMEVVIDAVEGLVGGRVRGRMVEDAEVNSHEDGCQESRQILSSRDGQRDHHEVGREGGRQNLLSGSSHQATSKGGNMHLSISSSSNNEKEEEDNDDDGPEEWEL